VWLEACNHPAGCRVILKDKLWMPNAIATHNTKVWPSGSCKRIFDPTFMVSDSIMFISTRWKLLWKVIKLCLLNKKNGERHLRGALGQVWPSGSCKRIFDALVSWWCTDVVFGLCFVGKGRWWTYKLSNFSIMSWSVTVGPSRSDQTLKNCSPKKMVPFHGKWNCVQRRVT
jgi:hypothetical protein